MVIGRMLLHIELIAAMQSDSEESQQEDLFKLAPASTQKPSPAKPEAIPAGISIQAVREKPPRLVIDHMVLEDFKSYAGRQVIGRFHHNFTSVIGPNGSGKSNLIESMLFIFGYSASWMRLNKLNQLIHKSSTALNIGRAAVEIHFKKVQDLSDGSVAEVPGSGFSIRRTVNSSSVSKYYLEGRDSTQAEVKERLRGEGIDLSNNRFLILQGEVEQISQMKQKSGDPDKPGLLQYLQDIIGSNQFIRQIQDCGQEYAMAQEQKHQKGHMMKLVENELKGMAKAKDQAVAYVKQEKKLFQLQNVVGQINVGEAKESSERLQGKLKELEEEKGRIIAEEREKLKKQQERVKEVKRNRGEMEEAEKQLARCNESVNQLKTQDNNYKNEIKFKSHDLVKYQRKIAEAEKEMTRIINQCEESKKTMPQKKETLKRKAEELQRMRVEVSKYDKPELRDRIKAVENEISKIELESSTYESKLQSVKEKMGRLTANQDEAASKIKQYTEKKKEQTATIAKIEKAEKNATQSVVDKEAQMRALTQQREELNRELRRVEGEKQEQMEEHRQFGDRNNMFRQIMQQGFPGVLGRLGDLGSVSKEYDEVLTSTCNRLDNIVVNDLPTAQAVLDLLKRKRLGRTTCIILDRISEYRNYMEKQFQAPPHSVRLFDTINFKKEEARLAFYFALSDTLYCQNSDLAMQYAMKNDSQRRRVVSRGKKGGFITMEVNGLMVGSAARRGGFETKATIRKDNKKGDEALLRDIDERRKRIMGSLEQVNKQITELDNGLRGIRQDLEQMKRELVAMHDSNREYDEELEELNRMVRRAQGNTTETSHTEKEAKAIEGQLGELTKRKDKLQGELKKLQVEQGKGETAEIASLRQRYKQQKAIVKREQRDYQRETALAETSLKRIQDLDKSKRDAQRKITGVKKEIDHYKEKQSDLQKKVIGIIGRIAAFEEKVKHCREVNRELNMIQEEDEREVKVSKAKIDKIRREVEECQEGYNRKKEELHSAERELEASRNKYQTLVDTYSFMESIDEIEHMHIAAGKEKEEHIANRLNSSVLDNSILNSSLDQSGARVFQIDSVLRVGPLEALSPEMVEHYAVFRDKIKSLIAAEVTALKRMEGSNLDIIKEYQEKYGQYRERLSEFEAVKERQAELKRIVDELKAKRLKLFTQGFGTINSKLKDVYQHLTRGGDAELELIDALDPFSDGVNFSVRPPKKSWKEVNKLSGGEKTLSSLSLIFALHYYKPTPLYFMDEIDAALDFKNVSIVADYIKKRTKDAQFIIISLRNNMFDLADKLVGVYKTEDKTGTVNFQPRMLNERKMAQKENQQQESNRGLSSRVMRN